MKHMLWVVSFACLVIISHILLILHFPLDSELDSKTAAIMSIAFMNELRKN